MSMFQLVNPTIVMDAITGTSSSLDSHGPEQMYTYTVLKDTTCTDVMTCTEGNDTDGMESSMDLALVATNHKQLKKRSSGSPKEKRPPTKKTWRGRLSHQDEKPWRKQKFIDKWTEDEKFKGWLARHPEDQTLARCISCNQELVAGKSELIKHSKTVKHIKSFQGFDSSSIVESESSPSKGNSQPSMLVWVLNDQECQTTTEVKVNEIGLVEKKFFNFI